MDGETTARAAERLSISEKTVVVELARVGFANILDYIKISPDGLRYTDLSGVTRGQAAAPGELAAPTGARIPTSPLAPTYFISDAFMAIPRYGFAYPAPASEDVAWACRLIES
jgi:hypothetical protein